MAYKNKTDVAVEIAIGSSLQMVLMGTIVSILIFIVIMFAMSKLGIGCCGSHSAHNHNSSTKSSGSSEKKQISCDDSEK